MVETARVYAVRSDVHGCIDLSREQFQQARQYAGLFDLGDVEAKSIDRDHPLRCGQSAEEQTMDAIIRNSVKSGDTFKCITEDTIRDTLASVQSMSCHLKEALKAGFFYRGIAGNAAESWTRIFEAIADYDQQRRLQDLMDGFDLIRECSLEKVNKSVVIYLPWKAHLKTLTTTLSQLDELDPARIVVLSHDYLTKASIRPEWQAKIRPMQNEEQAVITLDFLSQRDCKIVICYGHLGFEYEPAEVHFTYLGKEMTANHLDEKGGALLLLEL